MLSWSLEPYCISMKYFILILFMIGFVSAVDIEFDCPDDIFVDKEFECSLEVFDGDGEYDVKIDLDGERNSVLEVWNDGAWKSGYYYLQDFIESDDDENIKMRVSEEGDWDGELKLRQGDKREFFDIEIEAEINEKVENGGSIILVDDSEPEFISLNGDVAEEVDELVYVSKDARVVDWLPYGFALFLIFVIGILLWERF